MARTKRSAKLDSLNKRLGLPADKRHLEPIQKGCYLIYQRPVKGTAGTWQARWYDPETRKQKQSWIGTADDFMTADGNQVLSYAQAQAKAKAWFAECARLAAMVAGGETLPQGPFTVADAIADYLDDARRRGTKGVGIYESVARTRILPALGSVPVSRLTRKRIEDWHLDLAGSGRLRTGRRRPEGEELEFLEAPKSQEQKRTRQNSANRYLTILKRALNLALENRKIEGSAPWREVKPFKRVDRARTRFLNPEEQVRFVNACPPDFRRLVQAALLTGARYGELARIRAQDFHPESGSVWIAPGKTGVGRHVYLTEEAQAFFSGMAAGRKSRSILFTRNKVVRDRRTEAGSTWAPSDQVPYMVAACRAAKVEALTFHELRHTYASHLVNNGVALAYVAAQLGHTSTRMVEKHYGHLAPSAVATAIRQNVQAIGIVEGAVKIATLKLRKKA